MSFTSVIILAAGESSRMGQPKQTLQWEGTTLLQYQISQVAMTSAAELIVVLGYDSSTFRDLIPKNLSGPGLKVVTNANYFLGKTTSVKAGLRSLDSQSGAVMILAMDCPRTSSMLQKLIDCHVEGILPVTVPSYQGVDGHPSTFSKALFGEIGKISEERRGLREVVEGDLDRVRKVEFDSPLVLTNLNEPDDYENALGFARSGLP